MKKKLGIIGGMGPQAGAWLFQRILTLSGAESDQQHLEIILHNNTSIPDRTRAIVYGEKSPVTELLRSVALLNAGNVDVIALACMTSYYFYEDILEHSAANIIHPIPLILDELNATPGVRKIGLIGSTGLLKSRIFHQTLGSNGYEVVTLNDDEQEKYFMGPIYQKVKAGSSSHEASKLFLKQFDILRDRGADIVIGACSEVPLIVEANSVNTPFIDVFELLANKIVDYCYHGIQA